MNNFKFPTYLVFSLLAFTTGCNDSSQLGDQVVSNEFANNDNQQFDTQANSTTGKSDILLEAQSSRYASCNAGALTINRIGDEYIATITDSESP